MTSFRQIEANRRNAAKSTGPITQAGKDRSRRNAVRHGLCAETVVEMVEDIDDYRGFEAAVIADYDARTAVERELGLRLASLLWRLRRATSIETDLLRIEAEILRQRRLEIIPERPRDAAPRIFEGAASDISDKEEMNGNGVPDEDGSDYGHADCQSPQPIGARGITLCFQRLAIIDNRLFERLGSYETAIARQTIRTLLLLQSVRAR